MTKRPAPSPRKTTCPGLLDRIGLTRGVLLGLAAVILAVQFPFLHYFLLRASPKPTVGLPFSDTFERVSIGKNWTTKGGLWRIENGWLHSPGVKNNPLWLNASLPTSVAVEFDARSESADGDIKAEIFGNGLDHLSGYIAILGGWSNTVSILARLDEHGRDRKENRTFKVEKGKTYRVRLERSGNVLKLFVDGEKLIEYDDPEPLVGKGHDRFGFSSWDSDIFFDNLTITPL